MTENQGPAVSPLFCAADSDITFRSCDGVHFAVHRKNLEMHTGSFPPSEFETQGEIVPLTETSATLELLFQFIYPKRHPNLKYVEMAMLAPLAEAVEKYEVFSAMNTCETRMRSFAHTHPLEVLAYAARHGYLDILDEVSPLALAMPLERVVMALPPSLVVLWVRYYGQWANVFLSAIRAPDRCDCASKLSSGYGQPAKIEPACIAWDTISSNICQKLYEGVGSLLHIDATFAPYCAIGPRQCCITRVQEWRRRVNRSILNIQKFKSFI